jgi:hypothetical protein
MPIRAVSANRLLKSPRFKRNMLTGPFARLIRPAYRPGGLPGACAASAAEDPFWRKAPSGNVSAYEHRLAEVEKKLQALMEEMKSLRKKPRPDEPESAKP